MEDLPYMTRAENPQMTGCVCVRVRMRYVYIWQRNLLMKLLELTHPWTYPITRNSQYIAGGCSN